MTRERGETNDPLLLRGPGIDSRVPQRQGSVFESREQRGGGRLQLRRAPELSLTIAFSVCLYSMVFCHIARGQ